MDKLKLQYILINCDFPDSPLYDEVIATIIARRLNDYTAFSRGDRPKEYSLYHNKPQSRTNIYTGNMYALAESLAPGESGSFLTRFNDLLNSILIGTKVSSPRRVTVECRYFLHNENPKKAFADLERNTFIRELPPKFTKQLEKATLVDIKPPIFSYILPSSIIYNISSRTAYSDTLLKELFPNSYTECQPGGLVVTVELKEQLVEDSPIIFSDIVELVEEKVPAIAQGVAESIIESGSENRWTAQDNSDSDVVESK